MGSSRKSTTVIKNFFAIGGADTAVPSGIKDSDLILFNRIKSGSATQRSLIADMQFMVRWGDFRAFIIEQLPPHSIYDDIAARDADPESTEQSAISFVRNATGDPVIGQNLFGFYIYDNAYVLIASGEGVTYQSSASDGTLAIADAGTFLTGVSSIGDIRGFTLTKFIDKMLFISNPTSVNNSATYVITDPSASTVEVGTTVNWAADATYNAGSITDGDGTPTIDLTGAPNKYTFTNPSGSTADYNTVNLAQSHTDAAPYEILFETISPQMEVFYDAGTGTYLDSAGNPSNIFDAARVAASFVRSDSTIGRYNAWDGSGSENDAPTDSAGVRALGSKRFLSGSNTGSFSISIPATTQEVFFFVPAGKNVKVLYVESSNADVTGSFIKTTFDVDDAAGNPVSYDSYVSFIGTGGFPEIATYNVTVS